ncbi:MAG: hypothetical protein IPI67_26785 [Myxococcales bacterium]|nr:hypothetical protein [Myxococcales bacterium]
MTASDEEALQLASEILGLLLRRLDVSSNAADALDSLRLSLAAWGRQQIRPAELHRNLHSIYQALVRMPRDAPPGAFDDAYEADAIG